MVAQATPWHEKGHPEGCPSFPGGEARIRTGGEGFAGPCLTTWPLRHMKEAGVTGLGAHMERATGFEPATSTLARWRATNCAKPASARDNIREASTSRKPKFQIRRKNFGGQVLTRSGTRAICAKSQPKAHVYPRRSVRSRRRAHIPPSHRVPDRNGAHIAPSRSVPERCGAGQCGLQTTSWHCDGYRGGLQATSRHYAAEGMWAPIEQETLRLQ